MCLNYAILKDPDFALRSPVIGFHESESVVKKHLNIPIIGIAASHHFSKAVKMVGWKTLLWLAERLQRMSTTKLLLLKPNLGSGGVRRAPYAVMRTGTMASVFPVGSESFWGAAMWGFFQSQTCLCHSDFLSCVTQNPEDGYSRLKRWIMIGDHHQLPPVIKNMAFQKYSNMEQSLFTRFVRLGVPTVDLDAQGRARARSVLAWTLQVLLLFIN